MSRAAKILGIREKIWASGMWSTRQTRAVDSPGAASYGKAALLRHPIVKLCRFEEETTMKWTTPRIVEIAVGLEINAYACAEIA